MNISQGIVLLLGVIFVHSTASAKTTCGVPHVDIDAKWQDMQAECTQLMRKQVQSELHAALTYMAMGAHFARDTVNRPGFSKMFFESASEEREHAIKIMSYLLMRGELTKNVAELINVDEIVSPVPKAEGDEEQEATQNWNQVWGSGLEALQDALKLEVSVTNKIRAIIDKCESTKDFNDYQLVDYLTADFLEEQYSGQRDLAGKIQTLGKMKEVQGDLGEFLFDKKLLSGTLL